MLTATRSVRVMIGRIPTSAAELSRRFSGKPTIALGALALQQLDDPVGDQLRHCAPHVDDLGRRAAHHGLGRDGHAHEPGQAELGAAAHEDAAAHERVAHGDVVHAELDEHEVGLRRMHAQAGGLELGCSGARARLRPARGDASTKPASETPARPAASAARLTLNGS